MYEEFIVKDENWYTFQEMCDKYPNDSVFCWTKKTLDRKELYQPKIITTNLCPIDEDVTNLIKSFRNNTSTSFTGGVYDKIHTYK